ncbi:uncharacterized protein CLUP02_09180 [Colletotrichum lupini]|uniref:Uncharacterized protein n=1 Tax=Colletotrichum lupini TaxID=145971 RepID=A0A9Q8SU71_9PEZI|nr:uncharacterized protein CLUP02_09180 [Colletotrichum lupini]UQC83684.1 hypothetical protein CLUP02_09180 [Colletotrichum lupini]
MRRSIGCTAHPGNDQTGTLGAKPKVDDVKPHWKCQGGKMTRKAWGKGAVASVLLYVLKYPIFVELGVILLTGSPQAGESARKSNGSSPTCRNIPSSSTIPHNQRVSSSQQECAVAQRLAKLCCAGNMGVFQLPPSSLVSRLGGGTTLPGKTLRQLACVLHQLLTTDMDQPWVMALAVDTMDMKGLRQFMPTDTEHGWHPALSTSPTSPGSLWEWAFCYMGMLRCPAHTLLFPRVPRLASMSCRKTRSQHSQMSYITAFSHEGSCRSFLQNPEKAFAVLELCYLWSCCELEDLGFLIGWVGAPRYFINIIVIIIISSSSSRLCPDLEVWLYLDAIQPTSYPFFRQNFHTVLERRVIAGRGGNDIVINRMALGSRASVANGTQAHKLTS